MSALRPVGLSRASAIHAVLALAAACSLGSALAQSAAEPRVAGARELLNSERIEARFGSYGVEVLSSDPALRVSNLYSVESGTRTTRTFAIVRYPARVDPAFADAHAEILAGGSIGATLRAHGWEVIKTHRYFGQIESTPRLASMMRLRSPRPLAVHIYVLDIERGGRRFEYAAIAEIHHPDYLAPGEVAAIYAPGWRGGKPGDALVEEMLRLVAEKTR